MGTLFRKSSRAKIRWRVLDADGRILGRLAARASMILTGKSSPDYTPHADHRDGIIVINADKVCLTGKKLDQKVYRHHSMYPGGLKQVTARELMATRPERVVRKAIRGMLPKTRQGDRLARRIKVYTGPTHPHMAQQPESLSLDR